MEILGRERVSLVRDLREPKGKIDSRDMKMGVGSHVTLGQDSAVQLCEMPSSYLTLVP